MSGKIKICRICTRGADEIGEGGGGGGGGGQAEKTKKTPQM